MIGRELGGYRIIEQIGMGGMATVYKAYDPKTERNVAIKILPQQYSLDPTFKTRFDQEARAIANLEHIHILPVFAYGEEDGISYMVMRLLNGGSLSDRIRRGALDLRDAARILRQLGEALDYAHSRGVLHRDVKPSNALMDDKGNAYLTDFGIAKIVGGASADLTGSGLIGTPFYMSPEQCRGERELTPASDLYALGVVLYEMVTGATPFRAETPLAVLQMHLFDPLPLPQTLRPDLPDDAQNVILKALAKKPEERYASGVEMADAFEAALANYDGKAPTKTMKPPVDTKAIEDAPTLRPKDDPTAPLSAARKAAEAMLKAAPTQPPSGFSTSTIPSTTRRIGGGLIVGVLLALLGAGGLLLILPQSTRESALVGLGLMQPSPTDTPTSTPTPTDTPTATSTSTPTPTDTPTATPTSTPTSTPTDTPTSTFTPAPTPLEGSVFQDEQRGVLLASLPLNDADQRALLRSLRGAGLPVLPLKSPIDEPTEAAEALDTYNAALIVWTDAQTRRLTFSMPHAAPPSFSANEPLLLAVAWPEHSMHIAQETNVRFYETLVRGLSAYLEANYDEAFNALTRAEALLRSSEFQQLQPLGLWFYRGLAALALGQYREAIRDYESIINVVPHFAPAYHNLGLAYQFMDDREAARDTYALALTHDPDLAQSYNNRASLLRLAGDYAAALDDLNMALGIRGDLVEALVSRGMTHWLNDNPSAARRDYDRALILRPNDPYTLALRGQLNLDQDRLDEALRDYTLALEFVKPSSSIITPSLLHEGRGQVFERQKNFSAARADYDAVLELNPGNYGAYLRRAALAVRTANLADAIADYDRAIAIYDQDAEAFFQRGLAHSLNLDDSRALIDLSRAVEIDPSNVTYVAWLAYQQARVGQLDKAEATLQAVEPLNEFNAPHTTSEGYLAYKRFDYDAARVAYDQALSYDENFALAYLLRGVLAHDLGEDKAARADLDRAITLAPYLAEAYNYRGLVSQSEVDYASAQSDFEAALAIVPNYPSALNNLGLNFNYQGDYQQAIIYYDRALALVEDSIYYNNRGLAHYYLRQYDRALADFGRATNLDNQNSDAFNNRGLVYYDQGDYQAALADFERAAALRETATNRYNIGQSLRSLGRHAEALGSYQRAIELDPTRPDYYVGLGLSYLNLDDYEQAIVNFDQAIVLDPRDPLAHYWRGLAFYDLGDYQAALPSLQEAVRIDPNNAFSQYYLGLTYNELRDYSSALNALSISINLCESDCYFDYAARANSHYQLGNYDSALVDLNTALQLQPDYAYALNLRGLIAYQRANYANAIRDFSAAIDARANVAVYYENRADAYNSVGQAANALSDWNQALRLRAEDIQTRDLPADGVFVGQIDAIGQQIHLVFRGRTSQRVEIDVRALDGSLDTVILLRAEDGRPLIYNDDAPSDRTRSRIGEFILPTDGEYALVIAGYAGTSTGRFEAKIVLSEPQSN
ncbi:MAG: tetratricopeptide repeat protein [Anaerolineae bacterium]|nr:tetratricopeptide repeat protein [Anaerolineae bacterium]MDW8173395.1 tetratricopeptide repeat protein [Anaerolineae bacterium]